MTKETKEPTRYASVSWVPSDLTENYSLTEEEAKDFLSRNASVIQDRMVERGWDAIDDLLLMEGKRRRDFDSDEEDYRAR